MSFWSNFEKLGKKEIANIQNKLLKETIAKALKSKLYREKLGGIDVSKINVSNISKLPFTTKEELRKHYPYEALAVPLSEVRRIHSSSGTLGKPVLTFYTEKDLETWYDLLARNLWAIGVRPGDVFQNTVGHGLFTGTGYLFGAEKLGCTVIPYGPASPEKQLKAMAELGATAFHATPSFALKLADLAEDWGLKPGKDLKLRLAIIGAEFWTEYSRRRIEEALGIEAFNNYGLAEAGGPGIAVETPEHKGLMHVWADNFLIEVVDPETGEILDEGEEGELVITTLRREAMPLIRFRTGDIVKLKGYDCGLRPGHPLISWIKGRLDDMVKVRGVGLYPENVEEVIMGFKELKPNYVIILTKYDDVKVLVEAKSSLRGVAAKILEEKISQELKKKTMLRISVEVVSSNEIEKYVPAKGKIKRIIDLRTV